MGQQIDQILQQVISSQQQRNTEGVQMIEPDKLSEAFELYFSVVASIGGFNDPAAEVEIEDINLSEFGDYGLFLLSQVVTWNSFLQLEHNTGKLHQAVVTLAHWLAEHDAQISDLPQLVNSISWLANHDQETTNLGAFANLIEKIVDAVTPVVRIDEHDDPWRVLNFNYGIVATRSHDANIIENTFTKLMLHLPDSAAAFFSEGMEQMDIVGYPDHVREIMEKYYQLTNKRVLH